MAHHIAYLFVISLFIKGYSCQITAPNVEAKEGEEVILKCSLSPPVALGSCVFTIPGLAPEELATSDIPVDQLTIKPVDRSAHQNGICEGKLRVSEKHNGLSRCSLRAKGKVSPVNGDFKLTVLKAPRSVELYYDPMKKGTNQLDAKIGDRVSFTCKSVQGRPAANLRWLIDGNPPAFSPSRLLYENSTGDLNTVSQNLTFTVEQHHQKKSVTCLVSHKALDKEQSKEIVLNVLFPPKSSDSNPTRVYGLPEGEETTIWTIIEANPFPKCVWMVNNTVVGTGSTPGYTPGVPRVTTSTTKYNVSLKISQVEKSYDYIRISVDCSNPASKTSYIHHFEISTREGPPASTGLGINAILAIAVGVLFVLLVALLLVYARVKGRWCFAGTTGAQAGGRESSDTESAEQQQKAKKQKKEKLNLKVFFRKSPPESKEAEKSSDPLNPKTDDAVVYAELDLKPSSTQPTKPATQTPGEKTEYAEIIPTKKAPST